MPTLEELTKQFKADNPDLTDDEALHLAEQSLNAADIMPFTESIPEGYIAHKYLNFAIKGDKFNKETLAKFYQMPEFLALDVSKRASIKREFNKMLKAQEPAQSNVSTHTVDTAKPTGISPEQHKKNLKHVFTWGV